MISRAIKIEAIGKDVYETVKFYEGSEKAFKIRECETEEAAKEIAEYYEQCAKGLSITHDARKEREKDEKMGAFCCGITANVGLNGGACDVSDDDASGPGRSAGK